jgi:hypothetical protein
VRRLAGLACVLAAALAAGCVSTGSFLHSGGCTPACQAVATWSNQVAFAADPTRGGVPAPGVAGRLYLFGPTIDFPQVGDGGALIDLYDESAVAQGGQAVHLERWNIDPDTLKRLLKRDAIGWGYTLFLPWGTYKPEITQVRLKVCYTPAKGTPLYAEGSTMTLTHDGTPVAGAAPRPPAAGVAPAAHRPARPGPSAAGAKP